MTGYAPSDKSLWDNIRVLLKIGHRPQGVASLYAHRGVTVQKIRWRNHKYWHIDCKATSLRGPRCPKCRKRIETFKKNLCKTCYYEHERKGRPSGEDHYAWKGGKTKDPRMIRLSSEYRIFRKTILVRDKYQCQVCGTMEDKPQVDHIIPQLARPDLIFEPRNCRTICGRCHRRTATFSRKSRYFRWLFRARRFTTEEKLEKFQSLCNEGILSETEYNTIEYFLGRAGGPGGPDKQEASG